MIKDQRRPMETDRPTETDGDRKRPTQTDTDRYRTTIETDRDDSVRGQETRWPALARRINDPLDQQEPNKETRSRRDPIATDRGEGDKASSRRARRGVGGAITRARPHQSSTQPRCHNSKVMSANNTRTRCSAWAPGSPAARLRWPAAPATTAPPRCPHAAYALIMCP